MAGTRRATTTKSTVTDEPMTSAKIIDNLKIASLTSYKQFYWDALEVDPTWNERDTESPAYKSHVEWLESDIERNGVRDPLKGFPNPETNKIKIFSGHCRYAALGRLWARGIKIGIPVDVNKEYEKISDADRILSMLIDNSGLELDILEKARVVRRLKNYSWSLDDIGKHMKPQQSAQQIEVLLNLDYATEATKELVKDGTVKPTTVSNLIKQQGADRTESLLTSAAEVAKEAGVKTTANLVQQVQDIILDGGVNLTSSNPEEKAAAVKTAAEQVKAKRKITSADLLADEIDPETGSAIIEGVKTRQKKKKSEQFKKEVTAAMFIKKIVASTLETSPPVIAGGKVQLTFSADAWEEIVSCLETQNIIEPTQETEKAPEVEGQLTMFTEDDSEGENTNQSTAEEYVELGSENLELEEAYN